MIHVVNKLTYSSARGKKRYGPSVWLIGEMATCDGQAPPDRRAVSNLAERAFKETLTNAKFAHVSYACTANRIAGVLTP